MTHADIREANTRICKGAIPYSPHSFMALMGIISYTLLFEN